MLRVLQKLLRLLALLERVRVDATVRRNCTRRIQRIPLLLAQHHLLPLPNIHSLLLLKPLLLKPLLFKPLLLKPLLLLLLLLLQPLLLLLLLLNLSDLIRLTVPLSLLLLLLLDQLLPLLLLQQLIFMFFGNQRLATKKRVVKQLVSCLLRGNEILLGVINNPFTVGNKIITNFLVSGSRKTRERERKRQRK